MEKDPDSEKTNDVTKKGEELSMELEKIYGPNGSASEEAKKIFEDELSSDRFLFASDVDVLQKADFERSED